MSNRGITNPQIIFDGKNDNLIENPYLEESESKYSKKPTASFQPQVKRTSQSEILPLLLDDQRKEGEKIPLKKASDNEAPLQRSSMKQEASIENKNEAANAYSDYTKQFNLLQKEYQHENEKEIPAHSSEIIYQCLHPLQADVKDEFSNIELSLNDPDQQQNQNINQEEKLPLHLQENNSFLEVCEYLVVLEQLTQAFVYDPSYEQAQSEKIALDQAVINDHKHEVSERLLLVEKKMRDQEEPKQVIPTFINPSPDEHIETTLSDKFRFYTKKDVDNYAIQNKDDEEDEKSDEHMEFEPPESQKDENLNQKSDTEKKLQGSNQAHWEWEYRQWTSLKNEQTQSSKDLLGEKQPNDHQGNKQITPVINLQAVKDQYSCNDSKQFRLSLWRLDKQHLTKLIIAEQTITVQNDVEVLNNKFCFSVEKNIIHITFQKDKKIQKTFAFKSLDLSFLFEKNHQDLKIEIVRKEESKLSDRKKEESKLSDPKKEESKLSDPVMFLLDTEKQEKQPINGNSGKQIKPEELYGMYFQDNNKGYFQFEDSERNSCFKLNLENKQETISHVFFGINDQENQVLIFSQKENKFKIQFEDIDQINEKWFFNDKKNDHVMISMGSLKCDFKNDKALRALYHQKFGILIYNDQKLIQISNFYLTKKDKPELKIYDIENLIIPLNAQCQSQLSMKCKFRENYYLFLFQDLIDSKSIRQLFDNDELIRIPPKISSVENQQFSDFIVSLEKTATVHELTIADLKINRGNKHLLTPIITFITHDYLNQRQQVISGYQQKQTNQNVQQFQMNATNVPDLNVETLQQQNQNVFYNEPYIFEVINQITLNIYCTLDPKKNYQFKLNNHFECFLEFQEEKFLLPNQEANGILYRHQICMMITYNLKAKCHQIEVLVMPSYNKMPQGFFQIITLPYKLDLDQPGSILNSLITGHYHQLYKREINEDDNDETPTKKKIQSEKNAYSKDQTQEIIVLQFINSITQINLTEKIYINLTENKEKINDTYDSLQSHPRSTDNSIQDKGNSLKGNIFRIKEKPRQGALKIQKILDIMPTERNLKIIKTDITAETGGDLFEILKSKFEDKSKNLVERIRCYLLLIPKLNDINIQDSFDLAFIQQTNFKFIYLDQGENIVTFTQGKQPIKILQFTVIKDNLGNLLILTLDDQFVVSKYQIVSKNQTFDLILKDKTIPNDKANSCWRKKNSKQDQEYFDKSIKNLNQMEIVLTHEGVYFDYQFFQNIYESNKQQGSIIDFEKSRDSNVSNIFSANSEQIKIDLIFPGAFQSPDQTSLLFSLCRCKDSQINDITASVEPNRTMTIPRRNNTMKIQNYFSTRNRTIKFFSTNSSQKPVKTQKQSHRGFYFLSIPIVTNKFKQIMPIDGISKSVEYTSFIENSENEGDDVLVKLKSRVDSLGFLIFSRSGEVRRVVVDKSASDLYEYEVVQFMPLMKRQTSNNEKQKKVEDKKYPEKDLIMKILLRKSNKYEILNISKANDAYFIEAHQNLEDAHSIEHRESKSQKEVNNQDEKDEGSISKLYANQKDGSIHLIRLIICSTINLSGGQKNISNQKEQLSFPLRLYIDQNELELYDFKELKKLISPDQDMDTKKQSAKNISLKIKDFDIFVFPQSQELVEKKQRSYLVIKFKNNLHYALIEENDEDYNKFSVVKNTEQKIQISFRNPGYITQVLQVQREDQLQIMYFEENSGNYYLLLWSLARNQEISLQTFKISNINPFYQVFKGTQMRDNFLIYIGQQYIQDLRLDFPQNFLSGKFAWNNLNSKKYASKDGKTRNKESPLALYHRNSYRDELKISFSYSSKSLGIVNYGKTQVQRSYSYIDLQYIDYLFKRFSPDKNMKEDSKNPIILERVSVYLPYQSNILHFFTTNQHFLELYLKEIPSKKEVNDQGSSRVPDSKTVYAYYPLIPNCLSTKEVKKNGRRPFSIALKAKNNINCFEVLVQMLMCDSRKCYISSIKPYFQTLLEQKSEIIFEFLEHHTSKFLYVDERPRKKKGAFQCKKKVENIIKNRDKLSLSLNPSNSQYLNFTTEKEDDKRKSSNSTIFCGCCFGSKQNPPNDNNQLNQEDQKGKSNTQSIVEQSQNLIDNQAYSDDDYETKKVQSYKSIELHSYDFDGFLYGKKANDFLNFVIENKDNTKLFDIKYIEMLITYQWRKSWLKYLINEMFFNLVMFGIFIIVIYIQQKLICDNPNDVYQCTNEIFQTLVSDKRSSLWDSTQYTLFWILIIGLSFVIILRLFFTDNSKRSSIQANAEFALNIMYILKVMLDAMMIIYFRDDYLSYNFQLAPENQEDLWLMNDPEIANSSLDQQYAIRVVYIWIFMIKAGNACIFILFPLILIYRNRFLFNDYVPRLFLVLGKLWKLFLFFVMLTCILSYTYWVVTSLNYNSPTNESNIPLSIGDSARISRVDITNSSSVLYRNGMLILIIVIILIMFWFGGVAMAQEDLIAKSSLKADKLYNKAKEMYEGNYLQNQESFETSKTSKMWCKKFSNQERFKKARYIIQSIQRQQQAHRARD